MLYVGCDVLSEIKTQMSFGLVNMNTYYEQQSKAERDRKEHWYIQTDRDVVHCEPGQDAQSEENECHKVDKSYHLESETGLGLIREKQKSSTMEKHSVDLSK